MFKHLSVLMALGLILMASCTKDEDQVSIEEYIEMNNLVTTETASGLHYIIHKPGGTEKPTLNTEVTVTYNGYLLNGKGFDSGVEAKFQLKNLIQGWQEALQLIGKGGSMTLLVPSELGYGSRGSGTIPPNTDIGFELELVKFR